MQLIKLYSNINSFKTISFNETGLNFIVAKQKEPHKSDKSKTYNGVGKSLLIRIIHFCLGSDEKEKQSFCGQLNNWEFSLEIRLNNDLHTIKRAVNELNKITIDNKTMSLKKFREFMFVEAFKGNEKMDFISFRSLIPFFIRPKKESYVSYDKPTKNISDFQKCLYNSFLLGLDLSFITEKYNLKISKSNIKNLDKSIKKDPYIKEILIGNKDVVLELDDLYENIRKLESNLHNLKIADDYYEIQKEADLIETQLFRTQNKIVLLKNNLENIEDGLSCSYESNRPEIEKIYNEAKIYFSDKMTKTLLDLEVFYRKLEESRKSRLLVQKNSVIEDIKKNEELVVKLQDKFNKSMKYLGEHNAFDVFISINDKLTDLKQQANSLSKLKDIQIESKQKLREIGINMLNLSKNTDCYLNSIEDRLNELKEFFRKLSRAIYPSKSAGITIENNEGDNQIRYLINVKIDSDGSDGINNVKIFCYDLTILIKGSNHNINMIFHDSRLYEGIDARQKAEMFRLLNLYFKNNAKQYIATINQNQLDELKSLLSPVEFNNIIVKNTILTLTDESDDDKLLGVSVNINDN